MSRKQMRRVYNLQSLKQLNMTFLLAHVKADSLVREVIYGLYELDTPILQTFNN